MLTLYVIKIINGVVTEVVKTGSINPHVYIYFMAASLLSILCTLARKTRQHPVMETPEITTQVELFGE